MQVFELRQYVLSPFACERQRPGTDSVVHSQCFLPASGSIRSATVCEVAKRHAIEDVSVGGRAVQFPTVHSGCFESGNSKFLLICAKERDTEVRENDRNERQDVRLEC